MDPTTSYEAVAARFLAGRGGALTGIGSTTVRAWVRKLSPGSTVLDLGCGSGLPLSQLLFDQGLIVYAVEAAPTLAAAFSHRFPHAPLACEAVEDSEFFQRRFDGILAWGLVFLLPGPAQEALLRKAAAASNPGGRLLFTAPEQMCAWLDAMTDCPSRSLGGDAYRGILQDAGLELMAEYEDEGENHYYEASKPEA